ncbi:MAG: hypothetical protein ACK5SQ_06075 [Chitinophagales bacterium]|jgi:hypothetical protein
MQANHSPLFTIPDEAEACAAILLACHKADEILGDQTNVALMTSLGSRNIFIGYDPQALLEAAEAYYQRAGSPQLLIDAASTGVREQTRLPLFYHSLDVILAKGLVTPTEHKVIQYLKGKFKIDDETAFHALEVLTVKNQL